MVTVRASPMRTMTTPDSGMDTAEPMAMHSRIRPSTPGVTSSRVRTCGIRAAQLANANPEARKVTPTALRARRTCAACGEVAS